MKNVRTLLLALFLLARAASALECTPALVASAPGPTVTLTWVSDVPLFKLWYPRAHAHGLRVLAIPESNVTGQRVRSMGVPTLPHAPENAILPITRCFVDSGVSVLVLDVDAMLTGNVLALAERSGADVATIMEDQRNNATQPGSCLAVAYFKAGEPAASLLRLAQDIFEQNPIRALMQQSFARAIHEWTAADPAANAALAAAYERARYSCQAQVATVGGLAPLRIAYLPYDASVKAHPTDAKCRNVACAGDSWVVHCFGSMLCAESISY